MKIPNEQLNKYNIGNDEDVDELTIYHTFLLKTDAEIIKGFETLLSDPSKFLTNIISLAKTLKDIVGYRAIARSEIDKEE